MLITSRGSLESNSWADPASLRKATSLCTVRTVTGEEFQRRYNYLTEDHASLGTGYRRSLRDNCLHLFRHSFQMQPVIER
jgi:hypothetical protein